MRARNTLIMAIVALLLVATVYFLEIRGADEREEADAVAERLLLFESDDITGLTLASTDGSISLARQDGEWTITAPYPLAADQANVAGIVNALQTADHERLVEEAPEDLGRFGLGEPAVTVTLTSSDGASRSLALGNDTPVGFNVFVKRGDEDAVYITAASLKSTVNKTLYDLRDRTVLSFADIDVARIDIETEALTATVERQPALGDGITRWQITAPLSARADAEAVGALLQQLRAANAVAFATDAPTDEDLAAFGLTEPELTLRLGGADGAEQTLIVGGAADEPAGRYARNPAADAVMIVGNALINELPDSADALRNRTVVEFARDRINAIEVAAGDDPVRIEKDGVDWRIRAPRALDGDAGSVAALLTAALGLRALEFPDGSPDAARFGFAAPRARISFELEALPGEDAGGDQAAATVAVLVGAATEVAAEATDDAEVSEPVAARYVHVEGEPTVFVVAADALDDIELDLFALRSKTLVAFAQSELTRIEVVTPDVAVEAVKNEAGDWVRDGAVISALVDDALWRLNYLDMQSVAAETSAGADLSAFGLDAPRMTVRASIGDVVVGEVSIGGDVPAEDLQDLPTFGAQAQDFAVVSGTEGVFRINASLRDALQALLDASS